MRNGVVSICITTYNRASLVKRALDSALKQTYQNLEIVVVDDGSTDQTALLLADYASKDRRIKPVILSQNRGVNGAKNCALDAATGEFSTLLDSDDEFLPEAIQTFVDMFAKLDDGYGMVFCNVADADTGEWTGQGLSNDCDVTYDDTLCARWSGEYAGMWRTRILDGLRFPIDEGAREINIWTEVYRRCKVRYGHVVVRKYYRSTPGSVIAIRYDVESARRQLRAVQSYLRAFGDDILRRCPRRLGRLKREVSLYAALSGERGLAFRAALSSVRHEPRPLAFAIVGATALPRELFARVAKWYFESKGAKST